MTRLEVPQESGKDKAHSIVKGAMNAVPYAGGLLGEVFELMVKPSFTKRQQEWMESITLAVQELQEKSKEFETENLRDNDEFISILIEASQIAIKTHQKKKLERLRNIVINSITSDLEFDLKKLFLNYVDDFTDFQIHYMKLVADNELLRGKDGYKDVEELNKEILEKVFKGDAQLMEVFKEELETLKGLIFHRRDEELENKFLVLSNLGRRFWDFITNSHP